VNTVTRLRHNAPFFLLLTHVVLFFAFILAPIVIVVVISFSDQTYITFPIQGVSLRWFRRIYEYRSFLDAFVVSLEIAALSAMCAAALGIPAALALARARGRLANAAMTLLLSPLSIPLIVLGFALLFYLSAIGFGVSFVSLLIAHSVVSLPYVVRTVAAVYRGMAPGLEEAAAVLGASRWRVFLYITLPLIRPGIFAGCLFAVLISVDNLPISYFFGSASTNTLPVVMLSYLENQLDPTIAAVSTAQLVFAVALLLIAEVVSGRRGVGSLVL
jgi:putative spermidine/putrescine transport system permease protein